MRRKWVGVICGRKMRVKVGKVTGRNVFLGGTRRAFSGLPELFERTGIDNF